MTAGIDLLTWLANHLSQIPDGVGAEDQSLRAIRRAWGEFAPPGVSRVQTDSIRRLYLGTVANGHSTGRTLGIVQWVTRGRRIEQAQAVPQLAMSWAVAVDQADPAIAVLSRDALKRRQKTVRTQTARKLAPAVSDQLGLGDERAGTYRGGRDPNGAAKPPTDREQADSDEDADR